MIEATMIAAILGGFTAGLAGSAHCFAMCGAIASSPAASGRPQMIWSMSLGRLLSYALIGALGAGLVNTGADVFLAEAAPWLRAGLGMAMALVGLSLLWRGQAPVVLQRAGQQVWARLQPLSNRFFPPRNHIQGLAAGSLWGWLPCGLVYAVAPMAWLAGSWFAGALVMVAFGLATMPSMLGVALGAGTLHRIFGKPGTVKWSAALLVLLGLWVALVPWVFHQPGAGHMH